FGPLPSATAKQIAQSVQAWRHWLSLQDPPERIPEHLDRPYLAEAEQTPEVIREPLPRPQLAQAEDAHPSRPREALLARAARRWSSAPCCSPTGCLGRRG